MKKNRMLLFVFAFFSFFLLSYDAKALTINYYADGGQVKDGKCDMSPSENYKGKSFKKNCFVRDGYEFQGWYIEYTSEYYNDDKNIQEWQCKDGTWKSSCSEYKLYKDQSSLDEKLIEDLKNHGVDGWQTYEGFNKAVVGLHAVWKNKKIGKIENEKTYGNEVTYYTIQYGVSGELGEQQTVVVGSNTPILKYSGSKKDFIGWTATFRSLKDSTTLDYCVNDKLGQNCAKKIFKDGFSVSEFKVDNDAISTYRTSFIVLEAIYKDNAPTYEIRFRKNSTNATGEMDSETKIVGIKQSYSKNKFSLEGYKFVGWEVCYSGGQTCYCADGTEYGKKECNDSHGGLKLYEDGGTVTQAGNAGDVVIFNARWEKVENNEKIEKESNNLRYLKCGDAKDIPEIVPHLTSYAVTLLKTAVPIVLIIMSIIQLVKAITGGKDDEIKKAQNSLIKKVIIAALVFFIVSIVQFVMLKVADSSEKENLSSCLSCFLNGTSDCGGIYTKDGYGSCIYVDTNDSFECDK